MIFIIAASLLDINQIVCDFISDIILRSDRAIIRFIENNSKMSATKIAEEYISKIVSFA